MTKKQPYINPALSAVRRKAQLVRWAKVSPEERSIFCKWVSRHQKPAHKHITLEEARACPRCAISVDKFLINTKVRKIQTESLAVEVSDGK